MKKFNLGLQLYGVRNALKEDYYGTLRAVRDMGYKYVELVDYSGKKSAEEVKAILDELGLVCESVHLGIKAYEADPEAEVRFLKTVGVKYAVIPWYERSALAGTDKWEETVAKFRKMAEHFAANGILLGYHNHDFEFQRFEGKFLHDLIFEAIPADKIFPEIDTCWVRYAGLSPEDKIREFAGRVPVVHLKDFTCNKLAAGPVYDLVGADAVPDKREDNAFEFRPVGYGMQNFDAILAACEEAGTETVIVEQDSPSMGKSELECARLAAEYLHSRYGL